MENKMKLVIQIRNQNPVELVDFSKSMISVGNEYRSYATESEPDSSAAEAKLYVKEIRNGCIIAEMVAMAPYALQFIEHSETVAGYAKHLKNVVDIFLGSEKRDPAELSKITLNNVSEIVNPVAKDSGSQMNVAAVNVQNIESLTFNITSTDANALQNCISRELERRKEPETGEKDNVVLYWVQARGDESKKAGDRGKIESIYNGDVRVKMPDSFKNEMITDLAYPFKKAFLVDVDVQTVEGKPVIYNVKHLHEIIDR